MKIQVRNMVFETNSSSTHTLTICNEVDYIKWKNGELVLDMDEEGLFEIGDIGDQDKEEYMVQNNLYTYERYMERAKESSPWQGDIVTPKGDKVIIFGCSDWYY